MISIRNSFEKDSAPVTYSPRPAADRSPQKPVTPVEQGNLFTARELAATYETAAQKTASGQSEQSDQSDQTVTDDAKTTAPQPKARSLEIDPQALTDWKHRIITFQKTAAIAPPVQQTSLFDFASISDLSLETTPNAVPNPSFKICDLNPFILPRQNTQFWRWKASDAGVPAIYFVIDYACDLLLYVGETVQSEQRWKGEHGCKNYLLHYQQAHYIHNLPTQLGITFWKEAPLKTRDRQKLESELIHQWRSPFNKENWTFWGTPFVQPV